MKQFKDTSIMRAILAVLILFIPLYPKFPLTSIAGTYVAIRLDDIVVSSALLVWFFYQLKKGFPVFKLAVFKLFLAYFITITIVNLISYFINQTDPLNLLLLHLFRRFEYMSLFFVAVSSIYNSSDLKYPLWALTIATVFSNIYGYGQKFFNFPIVSTMNEEFSKGQLLTMSIWTRISSTFAGHYDYASFLSVVLIILGAVFLISKNKFAKIALLLVWLSSFQMLTFTASRVSIFAFYGAMVLTIIFLRKYIWILPTTLLVIFSIFNSKDLNQRLLATIPSLKKTFNFTLPSNNTPTPAPLPTVEPSPTHALPTPVIGMVKLSPTPTVFRHPVEQYPQPDVDVGVARSGEIRFNVEWPRALNALKKNPLIGTGLGSLTLATDNDYLRALGESGVLGFISFAAIFLWFIVYTFKYLFSKSRTKSQTVSVILFGAMLVQFANAIFIDVFEASKTAYLFWIMMGVYYQALQFSQDESKKE